MASERPVDSSVLLTVTGGEEPMGAEPPECGVKIRVPAGEREVALGPVSAEDTWSFSAKGQWKTGFVSCGPDGYRNFLYDALNFKPRVAGEARLKLMCKFRGDPDSEAFPIGAGCTKNLRPTGRARRLRQRSAGGLRRQSRRGHPHRRARRSSSRAARRPRRLLRPMARDRRHLQSHGRRAGHRRLRPRRLGHPSFHGPGTRSCPRRWRRWIGRLGDRLCDRALVLRDFRPGAGRASSSLRTTEPTASSGGRAGSSNGARGCWPSCLSPRPVSRS